MRQGEDEKIAVLILAAGKGTRMKSDLPKVLHPLAGRPLLAHVVDVAREMGPERIVAVVGHGGSDVRAAFAGQGLIFVEQTPQLGTGHAVLAAQEAFSDFRGSVLILCGDVPLLTSETLRQFIALHRQRQMLLTLLTAKLDHPGGYGRVVKDENNSLIRIVEEKDATPEEKAIQEINTGLYCVESSFLFEAVASIGQSNAQREYYLTDIIAIGRQRGLPMSSFLAVDPDAIMGINSPDDLRRAEMILAARAR